MDLAARLRTNENWLLARILERAAASRPEPYLVALESVWQMSFQGLTAAFGAALEAGSLVPAARMDGTLACPVSAFGGRVAKRHREQGIRLDMTLDLLDVYRPACLDLLRERLPVSDERERGFQTLETFFDRLQAALCRAWALEAEAGGIADLEARNFELVTERDRYVSIFESIPVPILLLEPDRSIRNLNHAAAQLVFGDTTPGSWYYRPGGRPEATALTGLFQDFFLDLERFLGSGEPRGGAEWRTAGPGPVRCFRAVFSRMLDLPSTFAGILVVLDDLTAAREAQAERERLIDNLTRALEEVRRLSGMLPICAWCKKVRNDQGYWDQIETYIASHSEVVFSHGICPDCATRELIPPDRPPKSG
jgi:PAS domain-containing protein